MRQAIAKIQKLNNVESFLQINFIKGYKYIDRAGEIVNYFYKDNKEPKFVMNLSGLDIINPDEKIESIKISSKSFWAHFLQPDSLEQMDSFFGIKAKDIVKILDVEDMSRIGWRCYFVYEFETEEERKDVLKKFVPVINTEFEDITLTSLCKGVNLIINLRKVKKNDGLILPALLLDIDFYQKYDQSLSIDQIVPKLTEFKEVIRSEEFLVLINEILK
jgi:hypothetical protein